MRALIATGLILFALPALAGEQADAGQKLDDKLIELDAKIQMLEGNVSELDQKLQIIEDGSVSPEPEPPVDPPPPVVSVSPGQDPFVQHRIPGYIQAEDYDLGGNGVAYSDLTTGNIGGAYRTDDVDIKPVGESSVGHQVGWNADTEWLEYTVGATAGNYDLHLRVSSNAASPGAIRIWLADEVVAQVQVPNTGGWGVFTTVVVRDVVISTDANMILRLENVGGLIDLDYIRFVVAGQAVNASPTGLIMCKTSARVDCWNANDEPVTCIPDETNSYCLRVEPKVS